MLELKGWREKYEAMEREDDLLYRRPTIEESVRIYLALCHTASRMIEETKDIFLPEREKYLADLQSKMRKLTISLQKRYGTATEPS